MDLAQARAEELPADAESLHAPEAWLVDGSHGQDALRSEREPQTNTKLQTEQP